MYLAEKQIDERSLVLRLIDGDEDAFCELYASYKNRLIYFAMRFLKSREYAEDVFRMLSLLFGKDVVSSILIPLFFLFVYHRSESCAESIARFG